MKRIQHPLSDLEDYKHNIRGGVGTYDIEKGVLNAGKLLKSIPKLEATLNTVISEWELSMEHNLTNEHLDHITYLQSAACALLYRIPYNVTTAAYNQLSGSQQTAANNATQKYLEKWIEAYENVGS